MKTCADCAWMRVDHGIGFCSRHPYRYGWRRRMSEMWELLEAAYVKPDWAACPAFREVDLEEKT